MKTFLFQGDSITDVDRDRNNDAKLGLGYPLLFAADYGRKYPEQFNFINRGISGNRIVDVYARIKADIINLAPDYMSILIGINDVWHEIGNHNGVDAVKFEKIYGMLIEEIKEARPNIKLFLLEPFVLRAAATDENWDYFHRETLLRAAAVKRLAEKYNLVFIPLQEDFDNVSANTENSFWLSDGVHPTSAGHQLIKEKLAAAFDKEYK